MLKECDVLAQVFIAKQLTFQAREGHEFHKEMHKNKPANLKANNCFRMENDGVK